MAKKKAAKAKTLDKLIKEKYGDVLFSLGDIESDDKVTIPISPSLDMTCGGIHEGSTVIMTGPPKIGKCQPRNAIVYTPTGPQTIGSLQVNDLVCTPDGGGAYVLDIYNKPTDERIYELIFDNGDVCQCNLDHIWNVTHKSKEYSKNISLRDFIDHPTEFPYIECAKYTAYEGKLNDPYNRGYFISRKFLLDPNQLIPRDLAYCDISKRKEAIAGFLDALSITVDGVLFLPVRKSAPSQTTSIKCWIQSVGALCKPYRHNGECGFKIITTESLCNKDHKIAKDPLLKHITKINESKRFDEMVCIRINSPEQLYLTNGHTPTHNTSTCLDFAVTAQDPKYGGKYCSETGRKVYFYNIEHRFDKKDIRNIPNVDEERFRFISSSPGNILSGEDFLEICSMALKDDPGSVHILDSFSALCAKSELDKDLSKATIEPVPKLLAKWFKQITATIGINKNIIIGITHLMSNPGGYTKWAEKSGNAIQYQADFKLKAVRKEPWVIGEDDRVGQKIEWLCETSDILPPGRKQVSYFRYNHGLDKVMELIDIGVLIAVIKKAGAWYTIEYEGEEIKAQGIDNLHTELSSRPEIVEWLYKQVEPLWQPHESTNT